MSRELFIFTDTVLVGGIAVGAGLLVARARGIAVGGRQARTLAWMLGVLVIVALVVALLPSDLLAVIAVPVLAASIAARVFLIRTGKRPAPTRNLVAVGLGVGLIGVLITVVLVNLSR